MTIEMKISSVQDRGSAIISYELWIEEVDSGVAARKVTTYAGVLPQHTLKLLPDNITTGKVYKLKFRALNVIGLGSLSDELIVGLTAMPAKPAAAPVRDETLSTATSLAVNWIA
jgi:hypothetical protein